MTPAPTPIERADGARLTLEIRQPDPIAGFLHGSAGRRYAFTGWIELASAIASELPGESALAEKATGPSDAPHAD